MKKSDFPLETCGWLSGCFIAFMVLWSPSVSQAQPLSLRAEDTAYTVAAYVWPSCHDEPMSRETLWSEGTGEWEIIKKGDPRFEGHDQPRVPLWGYEMDDDPEVMQKMIATAYGHRVNTFIFDWYWYDGKPFLENTVNAFVNAPNGRKMKFYLMWANHDVPGNMWNHYRYPTDSLLWKGIVDRKNFELVVHRVIGQYFKQPNYFMIDGEPVFSVFSLSNLVKSFGSLERTAAALSYFRQEVKKAGFPGLHLQLVVWGYNGHPYLLGEKVSEGKSINEIISMLGVRSVTTYNWTGSGVDEDYIRWGMKAMALQNRWDSLLEVPYFPNVSIGWDDTPRYPRAGKESVVHFHNSPASFSAFLEKSRDYVRDHPDQPKIIIINAWNEWVEGSYLEPDMRWGYGYLDAVKKVMSGVDEVK